jgi:beta-lactamase superfamily II metal-dependent hydrolase
MSKIRSLSVGNGDMFYIKHNTDNFTIIDCCMGEGDQKQIVDELMLQSRDKGIVRFISTHPDDDHICGLPYLHERMNLVNFYCVENNATKPQRTDDFDQYRALRNDPKKVFHLFRGCTRKWMNEDNEIRKNSGLRVLWPIRSNQHYQEELEKAADGECPNNISIILRYSVEDSASIMWMGDLETDFMEKIKDEITLDRADILFAPHHGRDSGKVPAKWLEQIDPKLIVIGEAPSEYLNYYYGYNTITQNSAWDITFDLETSKAHIYVFNDDYSVDFLDDEYLLSNEYGNYLGTLKVGKRLLQSATNW